MTRFNVHPFLGVAKDVDRPAGHAQKHRDLSHGHDLFGHTGAHLPGQDQEQPDQQDQATDLMQPEMRFGQGVVRQAGRYFFAIISVAPGTFSDLVR